MPIISGILTFLCNLYVRAGFNVDDYNINQVRMYGRTPEYNHIMHQNLERHLDIIEPGSDVSVIYTTFGLPWPGSNPRGPMSNAAPFINEVFHENAYLNFLSFKRYIEQNEKDHNVSFFKTVVLDQKMQEQIIFTRMHYLVEIN